MPKRMPAPARLAAGVGAAAGVLLVAAACSSGSSSTGAAGSPAGTPATGSGTAAGGSTSGSGATVIKTASASAGTFLIDGSGRAVYIFEKDSGGTSACSGACAGAWPPVTAGGTVTASGAAKASDLGSITRSDGTKQVTYDGHPLYYYVGDSGPGTASGQGSTQFGAEWYLVAPSGGDVTAKVSSFTAGGSSSAPSAPAGSPSSSSAGGGWS